MKAWRIIAAGALLSILLGALLSACGDDNAADESSASSIEATSTSDDSTTTATESPTTSSSTTTTQSTTSSTASSTTTGSQSTTTGQSTTTENLTTISELNLDLRLPSGWTQDTSYGEWAFFGEDGFLVLTVMGSEDGLDALTFSEAEHVLRPYGSEPTIEAYTLDGRDARKIVPSGDSPAVVDGFRQSAVLVAMTDPDSYLALFGDPDHLDGIVSTLRWRA